MRNRIALLVGLAAFTAAGCESDASEQTAELAATAESLSAHGLPDAKEASRVAGLCRSFVGDLESVPHTQLTLRVGEFESLWDQAAFEGCEVKFETNDSLTVDVEVPSFDAIEGTEMQRRGWRPIHGIGADGPGSGIFGIHKDSVACAVRWAQPAYIDDDGTHVRSHTFEMTIQCRDTDEESSRW